MKSETSPDLLGRYVDAYRDGDAVNYPPLEAVAFYGAPRRCDPTVLIIQSIVLLNFRLLFFILLPFYIFTNLLFIKLYVTDAVAS